MDSEKKIERIKENELRIDELRIKQYETLKKIMELYKKAKESKNEQTD